MYDLRKKEGFKALPGRTTPHPGTSFGSSTPSYLGASTGTPGSMTSRGDPPTGA